MEEVEEAPPLAAVGEVAVAVTGSWMAEEEEEAGEVAEAQVRQEGEELQGHWEGEEPQGRREGA